MKLKLHILFVVNIIFSLGVIAQNFQMQLSKYGIKDTNSIVNTDIPNSSVYWDYNADKLFAFVDTSNFIRIIEKENFNILQNDVYLNVDQISVYDKLNLNGIFFYPKTNAVENFYDNGVAYRYFFTLNMNYISLLRNRNISTSTHIVHNKYQGVIRNHKSYLKEKGAHNILRLYQNKKLFKAFAIWEKGNGGGAYKSYKKVPGRYDFYVKWTKYPIKKIKTNEIGTKLGILEDSVKIVLFDTKQLYIITDSLEVNQDNKIIDFSINQNEVTVLTEKEVMFYTIEKGLFKLKNEFIHDAENPLFIKRKMDVNKMGLTLSDLLLIGYKNEVQLFSKLELKTKIKEDGCEYHDGFIDSDNDFIYLIRTVPSDNPTLQDESKPKRSKKKLYIIEDR